MGPPATVLEMGKFIHNCEGEMVCESIAAGGKVPHFNAPIYLENKVGDLSMHTLPGRYSLTDNYRRLLARSTRF